MKNKFIFLLLGLFLFTLVNATSQELGVFATNKTVSLIQGCANSTYSNLSLVYYPNSTLAINSDKVMTAVGDFYNYSFSQTEQLGTYTVYGYCDENGVYTQWGYTFLITPIGLEANSTTIFTYVLFIVIILLVILGLFFVINKIPTKNSSDENNNIIKISNLKYLRPVFWSLIYIFSMFIVYIGLNLSEAFTTVNFISIFLTNLIYVMGYTGMVLIVIMFFKIIEDILTDRKLKELIDRGIDQYD